MITIASLLAVAALAMYAVAWATKEPKKHASVAPEISSSAPVASQEMDETGIPMAKAKSLAFEGVVTRHYLSAPVVAVEIGEIPDEKLRDLPKDEDGDMVHATKGWLCGVVDLVSTPERFGFKPGQPVRYWSPLPSESKYNPNMRKMGLFELVGSSDARRL